MPAGGGPVALDGTPETNVCQESSPPDADSETEGDQNSCGFYRQNELQGEVVCSSPLSAVCPSGRGEVVGAAGRPQGPRLASQGAGVLLSLSQDTGGSSVCLSPAFVKSKLI